MATRLGIYNEALRLMGARRLVDLTEKHKSRHTLDAIWTLDDDAIGLIKRALNEGLWNYATRTVKLEFDSDIEPDFGYRYAFQQPSDYVRLTQISVDEYFANPLRAYEDENGYWWQDDQILYVRYVSSDENYGANLGSFPPLFTKFVAAMMADEACPTIAASKVEEVAMKLKKARVNARSKDAMEEPTRESSTTSWEAARTLGGNRRDIGSRHKLIG